MPEVKPEDRLTEMARRYPNKELDEHLSLIHARMAEVISPTLGRFYERADGTFSMNPTECSELLRERTDILRGRW